MGITYIVAVHIHILPNIPLWVKLMYNQLWSIHIYFLFLFLFNIYLFFFSVSGTHSFVKLLSQIINIFFVLLFSFYGVHEPFWFVILHRNTQHTKLLGVCVARQTYGDLLVILGSPRVTYHTSCTFDFIVNISSMYHLKASVKVI